jgi:hypothetical protein
MLEVGEGALEDVVLSIDTSAEAPSEGLARETARWGVFATTARFNGISHEASVAGTMSRLGRLRRPLSLYLGFERFESVSSTAAAQIAIVHVAAGRCIGDVIGNIRRIA